MTRDGYIMYCLYVAVSRHFSKGSYDFFKYNGKVFGVSEDSYKARNDIYAFEKAARLVPEADRIDFFVANLMAKEKVWIRNMSLNKLSDWRQTIEAMPVRFRRDCEFLSTYELDKLITGPDIPQICRLAMQNQITLETLVILNEILDFMSQDIKTEIGWPPFRLKVISYAPFVLQKIEDMSYYTDIMRDIFINKR